jgi:hypothetical protein
MPSTGTANTEACDPDTPLLSPMHSDSALLNSYDLQTVSITLSMKIESKVARVLSLLRKDSSHTTDSKSASNKPILVALVARGTAAGKCISIVEIAKRELEKAENWSLYQYTGYWVRLEKYSPKLPRNDAESTNSKSSDDLQALPSPDAQKVRNVACMVIYLATSPVAQLKQQYG